MVRANLQGDVGGDVRAERARAVGTEQQTHVFVLRQPLQRGRDALDRGIRRIRDAREVIGHPVEVAGGGVQRGGDSSASVLAK